MENGGWHGLATLQTMLSVDVDPWTKWDVIGSIASGFASILGLAFAAFAGVVAYRLFKVEAERDHKAEIREQRAADELRRRQAASLGFWHVGLGLWRLSNRSPLPFFNVLVGTYARGTPGEREQITIDFASAKAMKEFHGMLAPGEEIDFVLDKELSGCVSFMDNAGSAWLVDGEGIKDAEQLGDGVHAALQLAISKIDKEQLVKRGAPRWEPIFRNPGF